MVCLVTALLPLLALSTLLALLIMLALLAMLVLLAMLALFTIQNFKHFSQVHILQGPPYLLARYKMAILSKCADDFQKNIS